MAILRLMERRRTPFEEEHGVDVPDNPAFAVKLYIDILSHYPERAEGFYLAMVDLHGENPVFLSELEKNGLYV